MGVGWGGVERVTLKYFGIDTVCVCERERETTIYFGRVYVCVCRGKRERERESGLGNVALSVDRNL